MSLRLATSVGKLLTVLSVALASQACNGDDRAPALNEDMDGNDDADGGRRPILPVTNVMTDDGSESSLSEAGASSEPGAPVVEMLTPLDETDPIDVYQDTLVVECLILPPEGDSGLDTSTIFFQLLTTDGEELSGAVGERGDEKDVYEVTFPTQNVESGRVVVRCLASDDSAVPNEASAQARTFIDHGPIVEIISPEENAAESALGDVVFEYQVTPDKLKKSDPDAAVDDVTLSVAGLEFPMMPVEDDPEVYRTTVDFSDPTLFDDVPTGTLQVSVAATNLRGVVHSRRYEFVLDGEGPEVEIISPKNTAIIGGTVTLELKVTDASNVVDWETLRVQLNDVTFPFDVDGPWTQNGDNVRFTFESKSVTGSVVQINLNVLVRDEAGNDSPGASALYYRDEQPPIVSMDPPQYRQIRDGNPDDYCSIPFDPLGRAVAHGEDVDDIEMYRALVYDVTNEAGGETLYFSAADPTSVNLFARRAGEPLVVDTTEDGTCDDIAEGDDIRFQQLTALSPTSTDPPYMADYLGDEPPTVTSEYCVAGTTTEPPEKLCDGASDLWTVPYHSEFSDDEPVIYAVSPDSSSTDPDCTGREWELRSAGLTGYQGWVCLAVRASDRVGNRGVSPPIAVCLDNDQVDGFPDCWGGAEAPPECTDGCSPPAQLPAAGFIYKDR